MLKVESKLDGFSISIDEKLIIEHSSSHPSVFLGIGNENIKMFRGNFTISDRISQRIALRTVSVSIDCIQLSHPDLTSPLELHIKEENGMVQLSGICLDKRYNRFFLRFEAIPGEHVTGGGEQFSALDLRGKLYPIWTREQGVGRNKLTEITRLADALDGGGGDYHTTFFPQPTFISSRMYFAHLENYEYSELDFREENFHELTVWSTNVSLVLYSAPDYSQLLEKLSSLLGRQKELPAWAIKGIWLGVQGGTKRALELQEACVNAGMDVSAVWIQDWEGKRITTFGKRLQWDWCWNKELYPKLDSTIHNDSLSVWMGYINPYLVENGVLFKQAKEKNYFVKHPDGTDYLFDFGEFNCGVVDLTSEKAFEWYKNVIKTNLIDFGFKGWMADFGEYLPADAQCANGEIGLSAHNKWPLLWARCNREAIEESGKDCVFFMRSGAAGSQKYASLIWAGDQCVDWSEDDGLPSVITAALSLGMSGYGLHTCDIGGYTTLFHLKRDRELMLRWLEFACFTPVMRTHEGNRPESNMQVYSDDDMIHCAARLSQLHTALFPYLSECMKENTLKGLPVMRPLFLAEDSDNAYRRDLYSYLLGGDVLVCPVVVPGASERQVWLPNGHWMHLWTESEYDGGCFTIRAPIGEPPVFYRTNSKFADLFRTITKKYCLNTQLGGTNESL